MKRIFTTVILLMALATAIFAQPTAITWQGKLLDNSGNAITQNNVAMTFAMFDASTGGNQLWPASGVVTKTVDVVNGLYSVQLGTGTGDDIAFTAAMFDGKTPWLEVKVGTETLPRTEITNVPFALISNDLSAAAWETPGEIGKTTPNTGKFTSVETESLKVTAGASTGKVLTSDADGNASWTTPYTGLTNFTESNFTYESRTGVKFTPDNAATDVDVVLQPKGSGGILAHQPDGTISGGNIRGDYVVDFQCVRDNATQVASGTGAIILGGGYNTSSGFGSVVLGGGYNIASGDASAALGFYSTATGNFSLASGYASDATDDYSIAMGRDATASNEYAVAIGNNPTASGYASLAMGDYTTASGRISTAFGNRTTAPSGYETVLGRYNTDYTPSSTTDWMATDRLFVVGNGATDVTKSNALTILKNANTTIGGSLTLNGNGTSTSITFPTTRGTSGQFLKTAGEGTTSWSAVSKSDVGLGNVENTAISTWTGSSNITTLGTIASGTWQGTSIAESYIGNLGTSKITSGTFDNARINWAAPGTIGSTTRSSGAFTSLAANNGLSVSSGTINLKPSGNGGTSGSVLTSDGSGNASWQNVVTTVQGIRFIICVKDATFPQPTSNVTGVFIGQITLFAGSENNLPKNFLNCAGQFLNIQDYVELFSVIGTTYGGNGTTNFALPNFNDKSPEGQPIGW